ncbi:NAD-glutamate dehydrogenase [Chitinibacteraceae bacterium HSL-7]
MSYLLTPGELDQLAGNSPEPELVRRYYTNLARDDFATRDESEWLDAALAHQRYGARRQPGECLVRCYHPSLPDDGWECARCVVDIVCDDAPFLVDTVSMALARSGCAVHLVLHPVLNVQRDPSGQWISLDESGNAESWMRFEIDRIASAEAMQQVEREVLQALTLLRRAVDDWGDMMADLDSAASSLATRPPELDATLLAETQSFLQWLRDGHFVFLGCRSYTFEPDENGNPILTLQGGSGRGLLRDAGVAAPSQAWLALSEASRARAYSGDSVLILTKSDTRSIIHRPVYLDSVSIKRFDEHSQVCGELRLIGLYTASAYGTPARDIPLLRHKITRVLEHSSYRPGGHRGKMLLHVLDTYPRDELIEIDAEALTDFAQGMVAVLERNRTRTFFRNDLYQRYVSVMLFMPRDNYTTDVRLKVQKLLIDTLGGTSCDYNVLLTDSPLARIHFLVRTPIGAIPDYDPSALEAAIIELAQRWQDTLREQLLLHFGEQDGTLRWQRYQRAFSDAYCADQTAKQAVHDIDACEQIRGSERTLARLSASSHTDTRLWRLKIYRAGALELSNFMSLLEHLGVHVIDEKPYAIAVDEGLHLVDVGLRLPEANLLENPAARARLTDAFTMMLNGTTENDTFNRLVLHAGLDWRDTLLLRALARYLKQIGLTVDFDLIADCLLRHPADAAQLATLFHLRHAPDRHDASAADTLTATLRTAFDALPGAEDERILSGFLTVILACVRTNFYQRDARGPKPYTSFKFDSARIPRLPQPVPLFEIFVYSPQIEGIHLRGGKVARGGLRWSDRRDDFRTEVLGLVKAQMVKNTVIVPVGSKGGFVVKHPPTEREALLAAGIECYKTFIRGLLDITDNLVRGEVVPPSDVVRHDEDDPYLVVAADKGTAAFSDIANSVSREYGFWLDDAFASGGGNGYDHKKMGITARGAWVSVERHFREMGIDVAQQPITLIGIGDMSGDVFGNGLLRSRAVKLVGAFDHRHIFLDPTPDPETAYVERERLFTLPRSSWGDYAAEKISAGGGVFSRSARTIRLSPEIRTLLDVDADELDPLQLIQAMLRAPVDLLYNGGIGTYAKASTQTHADAADRANDGLRVDGKELRCKVVAEGGNLGFTQLARIEYAQTGGRIFTDAIDNSAGVDCSDREVNIKILLGRVVADGDLTEKQRNTLLASMTDEVAALVLRDNTLQTLAISLELEQAHSLLPIHVRMMQSLERAGRLSRRVEFLPSDALCQERFDAGGGLSRPELAVLLAYAKIALKQDLLAGTLVDDPRWDTLLATAFPPTLVQRFGERLPEHPLRRQIVATVLTNHVVNRYGMTSVFRLSEETGVESCRVVERLLDAELSLGSEALALSTEHLASGQVSTSQIYPMLLLIRRQTERTARWLLQRGLTAEDTRRLHDAAQLYLPQLASWLSEADTEQELSSQWHNAGVSHDLAGRVLALDSAIAFAELALVSDDLPSLPERIKLYVALSNPLGLDWLARQIERLPRSNRWQALARIAARDDLVRLRVRLTELVWQRGNADPLAEWQASYADALAQWQTLLGELASAPSDLAMMTAGLRELRSRFVVG